MKLHQSITLADGRLLSYADIGEPGQHPVFYFHGFPGSRLEAAYAEQTIRDCEVRVIAVERPGYGLSSHDPQRMITDWPGDIAQLADALGLVQFSILGVSAGGVYALACAHKLAERVVSTGIAGTLAPVHNTDELRHMSFINRMAFRFMARESGIARLIVGRLLGYLVRHYPGQVIKGLNRSLCANDRIALNSEQFSREFLKSIREAYRHGYLGPYHDLSLVIHDWGFEPEQISGPVYLWHGLQDSVVPHTMGQHLGQRLPNCSSHFPENEGHFSIITNYMQHALLTLKGELANNDQAMHPADSQQQTHSKGIELEPLA